MVAEGVTAVVAAEASGTMRGSRLAVVALEPLLDPPLPDLAKLGDGELGLPAASWRSLGCLRRLLPLPGFNDLSKVIYTLAYG